MMNHDTLDKIEAVSGVGYAILLLNAPDIFIQTHYKAPLSTPH